MSCVRGSNKKRGVGFLADRRRLNVGLTRGQDAVFVVGNASTLETHAMWKSLIDDSKSRSLYVDATTLLPEAEIVKTADAELGIEYGEATGEEVADMDVEGADDDAADADAEGESTQDDNDSQSQLEAGVTPNDETSPVREVTSVALSTVAASNSSRKRGRADSAASDGANKVSRVVLPDVEAAAALGVPAQQQPVTVEQ
eukprot:GFYU01007980.1.p1 GENE.GFYU01007980.1~~GFYU01007980.1.p1  ORF type:complete len:214 (-),score=70.43 GFYU01007980.1:228-827(-)